MRVRAAVRWTNAYLITGGGIALLALLLIFAALRLPPSENAAASPSASPTATATPSPTGPPTTAPPSATPSPLGVTTAQATPSAQPTAARGAISGQLGYPAEIIPPLTVYAISVSDP